MLTLDMFAILKKAFCLPSYVGGLVKVFGEVPSLVSTCTFYYNR